MTGNSPRTTADPTQTRSSRAPIEVLAEEYLEQLRGGRKPRISEYVRAHPELAAEIQDVFPTLAMLEDLAPQPDPGVLEPALGGQRTIPSRIGEYRVLREVGRGGMGVVYEAEHETMGRRVALKVLPHDLAARGANLQRFLREARSAGRLHHTNIVPVFEVGEYDGLHYYAMQFIQGQNLDVIISEIKSLRSAADDPTVDVSLADMAIRSAGQEPTGSIAHSTTSAGLSRSASESLSGIELSQVGTEHESYFQRVARVALQAAEALDYAHTQGILHRDIKPSNLLLDAIGVVWITDFGLAKHAGDDVTHAGDVVGTLRYMAPERFHGQADARSDIYSLGLTLYELCTLQHAFPAEDRAELLRQLSGAPVVPPRRIDPAIPRDLETVILKAIARDPGARYQHARELAEDLRLFLSDRPVRSRRSSAAERLFRWCRRNPALAGLSSVVLTLVLLLAAGSLRYGWRANEHAQRLQHETARALAAERYAEQARHEATLRLFHSYIDRARSGRWSGRPGQHFASLAALQDAVQLLPTLNLPPTQEAEQRLLLRNEAIATLPLIDVQTVARFPVPDRQPSLAAFTPDFHSYVTTDASGNLALRRAADGQLLRTFPGPGERAWVFRFSSDGHWLSAKYHRGGTHATPAMLRIWNVTTGQQVAGWDENLGAAAVAFSSDGREVAVGFRDGTVVRYALPSGDELGRIELAEEASCLACAPHGQRLAIGQLQRRRVVLVDLSTGHRDELETPQGVHALAWRSGHDEIALGCSDGSILLVGLEPNHRTRRTLVGHTRNVVGVNCLHQGRLLASRSWDGTTRLWCVETGREVLRIDGVSMIDSTGPLQDRLGFTRGDVEFGIWEVSSGSPMLFLQHLDLHQRRWSVRFHPQHARLVVSATSRGAELWDLQRQQLVTVLGSRDVRSAMFLPDGRQLVTSGADGIQTWDIELGSVDRLDAPLEVRVSAPVTWFRGSYGDLDVDATGHWFVARAPGNVAVVGQLATPGAVLRVLRGQANVDRVTLSPDGRTAVSTAWKGESVYLWDVRDARRIFDLVPDTESATARFSADGQFLAVTTGRRLWLWHHNHWLSPQLLNRDQPDDWPGAIAFSADAELLAAPRTRFAAQLLRPADGHVVAWMTSPLEDETLEDYAFSQDGRYLALADSVRIHVWDLQVLRQRLDTLGLDWSDSVIER